MIKVKSTIICSACLVLGMAHSAIAANSVSANHKNMNGASIAEVAKLNKEVSFKKGKHFSTANGNSKQRAKMFFKGVPVFGQSLVLEQDPAGRNVGLQGKLLSNIEDDIDHVIPSLSANDALKSLKKLNGHKHARNTKSELMIYQGEEGIAQLAYRVEYLVETENPARPTAFIHANTGEILMSYDALMHPKPGSNPPPTSPTTVTGPGGNEKTGLYIYGTDFPNLLATTTLDGSTCYLDSPNVTVIDMKNKWNGGSTFEITCGDTGFDLTNRGYAPGNDAMAFGNVVFDMYDQWYNTTPLAQKLLMRVHYGRNYDNAVWNGESMSFGDGDWFYPWVSLDISAHEVSHGVTEQRSGLVYYGEAGGINESFSDMAGEVAESYMHGEPDWLVAAQIWGQEEGALRYFADPTLDGNSIDNAADMTRNLDVHYSSGVYNKAFYLLSNTSGWTVRTAFEVMLRANALYWSSNPSFDEAACGVENAAADLGRSVADVTAALAAVGVSCQ